ncbi:VF530 family DNA-binding protein [Amphritea sp. 1_MG-2023]|uniref:VF530 family protein n=1 Tax=Amphritea sp. 1_MG-2023 TaxID=3062670 RepID=UPI0026E385DD|nr:VF530 family DNA-binding protein [Amphritea sp. 1_MG-2023]MDO6563948.1 VF530 family DNA-binding protein [Amphritea sp. 1_MG-2023]
MMPILNPIQHTYRQRLPGIIMTDEINYQNNPLHGLGLKELLTQIVDHYGFEILYAYLNINCFKTNPSIESSIKFLKKTDWAREKVELFYLYKFKNLPRVSSEQFDLSPRDRIIPEGQTPRQPAELSLEDAERMREKQALKAAEHNKTKSYRTSRSQGKQGYSSKEENARDKQRRKPSRPASASSESVTDNDDPWAKWRK